MFSLKRERFLIYYWKKSESEFGEALVLSPELSNSDKLAHKLLLERGYVVGPVQWFSSYGDLRYGVPFAGVSMPSSRSEVGQFLSAIWESQFVWDYKSIAVIRFDPSQLLTQYYRDMLVGIERSQRFRCRVGDFLGIRP